MNWLEELCGNKNVLWNYKTLIIKSNIDVVHMLYSKKCKRLLKNEKPYL